MDYAHNPRAYDAIIDTGRQLTTQRLLGVVAAPGDRRDEDVIEMGRICGRGFDELVLFEMDDQRGQPAGATAGRLQRGALAARAQGSPPPRIVLDVRDAIRDALRAAQPGDVIVLGCASDLSELRDALAGLADVAVVNVAAYAGETGIAGEEVPLDLEEANAIDA